MVGAPPRYTRHAVSAQVCACAIMCVFQPPPPPQHSVARAPTHPGGGATQERPHVCRLRLGRSELPGGDAQAAPTRSDVCTRLRYVVVTIVIYSTPTPTPTQPQQHLEQLPDHRLHPTVHARRVCRRHIPLPLCRSSACCCSWGRATSRGVENNHTTRTIVSVYCSQSAQHVPRHARLQRGLGRLRVLCIPVWDSGTFC